MPCYVNMNYMRTSVHTKAEDAMPIFWLVCSLHVSLCGK